MAKRHSDPARKAWPFFLLFVLVGCGVMIFFIRQAVTDWRIARVYQKTECEITGRRLVTSTSTSDLNGRRNETQHSHTEFSWTYEVNGRRYTGEGYDGHDGKIIDEIDEKEMGKLDKGVKHECWYDPDAPEKSVLVRRFRAKFYLAALIPGVFILIGGTLLAGSLKRKPTQTAVYVSQGEKLRHRLSPVISTRGIMGCLGTMIVILALVIFLVLPGVSVSQSHFSLISGKMWLYLIALGIEGFLIYHFLRALQAARMPDPVVEIGDEPLAPGQTTQVYVRVPGPAFLAALQVQLLCERVGVGSGGTRAVHKHAIAERNALSVSSAEEIEDRISIPEKGPASNRTVQTVTTWCIRIRRQLVNGMSYDTDYPFRVERKDEE